MCTQKPPHDYSQQLYEKYQDVFKEYINSRVSECSVIKSNELSVCISRHILQPDRYQICYSMPVWLLTTFYIQNNLHQMALHRDWKMKFLRLK